MLLLYNTAKSKGFVRFVTYSCSIAKVFVFHHTECDAPSAQLSSAAASLSS